MSDFQDESLSFEDQPSGDWAQEAPAPVEATQTAAESMFDLDGQQVPFSKLDPVKVKAWYDAEKNRSRWQSENTRKAQEIAEMRKKAETEANSYKAQLDEYNKWNEFLNSNPDIQQNLAQEIMRRKQGQQSVVAPTVQTELEKQIAELRSWKEEQENKSRMTDFERRKSEALDLIAASDPSFDKDDYTNFFNETTSKLDDTNELYKLMYDAYKARRSPQTEKDIKAKVVKEIQNKQTAAVEPGNKTSINNLPNNTAPSSYEEAFDQIKNEFGIKGE